MLSSSSIRQKMNRGDYDEALEKLYSPVPVARSKMRFLEAIDKFETLFGPYRQCILISAPGRTEIGGNHTDHQHGRVLAAAVNLDILCIASPNDEGLVRLQSEGYPRLEISLQELDPIPSEYEQTSALIRGIAAWFSNRGLPICGFDAYCTSDVLSGSGLSSSAAFEIAIGNIINILGGSSVSPEQIAIAGQFAENHYFGKPSGLMDQMASSVGGAIGIDFLNPNTPLIRPVELGNFLKDFHLCIVNTGGSHANLTEQYASIPLEMSQVANFFGKEVLREVEQEDFRRQIRPLRERLGDRAVLRAMHFFQDNGRIPLLIDALETGDLDTFFQHIIGSGRSSFTYLQNVIPAGSTQQQGLALALAVSEKLLQGRGAWRVHGGGFAGTIQAFVPNDLLSTYINAINQIFGSGACHVLSIRPVGGVEVTETL